MNSTTEGFQRSAGTGYGNPHLVWIGILIVTRIKRNIYSLKAKGIASIIDIKCKGIASMFTLNIHAWKGTA